MEHHEKCANCFAPLDDETVTCYNTGVLMHRDCANLCIECKTNYLSDVAMMTNDNRCKDCVGGEVTNIDFIRRSYIEDYLKCPYKFKLMVVDGKHKAVDDEDGNIYAYSGIVLHDMFADYATGELTDFAEMEKKYVEAMKEFPKSQKEEEIMEVLFERYDTNIDTFLEYHNSLPEPFAIEQNIKYTVDEDMPQVSITMDRLDFIDGEYHLTDYKTGAVITGMQLEHGYQVPTYCQAVYEEYGRYPKTFTLVFTREGKTRQYVYNALEHEYVCKVRNREYVVDMEAKNNNVIKVFQNIKDGKFSIPVGKLNLWYCMNRCDMYKKFCMGAENQAYK